MSSMIATVSKIETYDTLNIVEFKYHDTPLSMMSLELDKKITIGTKVKLEVKPTHIAIAKNFSTDLSCTNRLGCTIISLINGQLLSNIKLDFCGTTIEAITTLKESQNMTLAVGDEVTALILTSELSISEVL